MGVLIKRAGRFVFAAVSIFVLVSCGASKKGTDTANDQKNNSADNGADTLVPVHSEATVFIMPGCPHCATALKVLLPLYEESNGGIDLNIEYTGFSSENVPDLSLDDPLVAGASAQICVRETVEKRVWLKFMNCLFSEDLWKSAETSWEQCAKENNIDTREVTKCLLGNDGREALAMSMMRAAVEGINAAPTLFIDDSLYIGPLQRDALLTRFCYNNENSETIFKQCDDIEKPQKFKAYVLNDKRCLNKDECNVDEELDFLKALIPDALFETVDYSTPQGKELYENMTESGNVKTVPAVYFETDFKNDRNAQMALGKYFIPFENGVFVPLRLSFDPTKEICGNSIDDDDNGNIDCDDDYCSGKMECRTEVSKSIDLFIMSKCPYAAMIAPAVDRFLKHMDKFSSPVTLKLQFIGEDDNGELRSMHGPKEVEEDMRIACIQELYPEKNRYFEYFMCRARDMKSDDWESCLSSFMKKNKIEECVTGTKGKELLQESFKLANDTELMASPQMMINNKFKVDVRIANDILKQFCLKNSSPACDEDIEKSIIDTDLESPARCE